MDDPFSSALALIRCGIKICIRPLLGHDEGPEGNWVPTTPNGDSDYRGKGSQVADGNAVMKGIPGPKLRLSRFDCGRVSSA